MSVFAEPSHPEIQPRRAQREARGGVVLPSPSQDLSIPDGMNKP